MSDKPQSRSTRGTPRTKILSQAKNADLISKNGSESSSERPS